MSLMMTYNAAGGGGGLSGLSGGLTGLSGMSGGLTGLSGMSGGLTGLSGMSGGGGGGGVSTADILFPDTECILTPPGAPAMDPGPATEPLAPLHFPEYHVSGAAAVALPAAAAALPAAAGGGGEGGGRGGRRRRRRTPPKAMFDINDNSLYSVYCFFKSLLSASSASTVAIDNKIEQAMDLVKSHLMFAVREEVEVLKEKITELLDRISQLEYENMVLRQYATQEALQKIQQHHASNT